MNEIHCTRQCSHEVEPTGERERRRQRQRERERQRQRLVDCLWGTCSHNYGGWEVSWYSICKLKTSKARSLSTIHSVSKAWEPRGPTGVSQPQGQTRMWSRFTVSWNTNSAFLQLFILSGLQWFGSCPLTLERAICFTQSTNSKATLSQKHQ